MFPQSHITYDAENEMVVAFAHNLLIIIDFRFKKYFFQKILKKIFLAKMPQTRKVSHLILNTLRETTTKSTRSSLRATRNCLSWLIFDFRIF